MGSRYRIEEQLGSGRTGSVYNAYDTELERRVALRRFKADPSVYNDEAWRNNFFDVVSDLSRINQVNVLRVLDAGIDDEGPYLATARVEGYSLSQLLKVEGTLELSVLYSFTQQALAALQAAEEYGYYHHALSSSSVVCTKKASGGYHYTMMDLGHSKLIPLMSNGDEHALSKTLDPALMAPEIFEGNPEGIRSTLYMLGHMIYWLTIGGHPLAGLSLELAHAKHVAGEIPYIKAYRSDLPEAFRQWIYWLIQSDVSLRPVSVANAIEHLPSFEQATTEPQLPKPMSMGAEVENPINFPKGPSPFLR